MVDVVMESQTQSPRLRRRDAMGRTRVCSPARRCGIAHFPESISGLDDEVGAAVEIAGIQSKRSPVLRARRNIANFEMRHVDTESEPEVVLASKREEAQSSASEKRSSVDSWISDNIADDAVSSSSEGWSFERQEEVEPPRRAAVARSLVFSDSLSKAPSVQELVEGAESLVRMRSKCAIESRDASGESDSDHAEPVHRAVPIRTARPLSMGAVTDLLPPSGARTLSASETGLNKIESPRRRRARPRKKLSSLRKSLSGSDAITLSPGGGSDRGLRTPATVTKCDRAGADSSDSSTRSDTVTLLRGGESGDATLVMGDDTGGEEIEESAAPVLFRLGPDAGSVTSADCDKMAGEEPSSLNTEDCWDDYQEKYPSEAYSEEVADGKNLLDCDDYRQFLDSPSDTSRGVHRRRRVRHVRAARRDSSDTESEPEELTSLLEKSLGQLREVESLLYSSALALDYEELLSKCRDNINCLKVYLDVLSAEKFIISDSRIRHVLEQWMSLQARLEGQGDGVRARLQAEMEELRCELSLLVANCANERPSLHTKDQLDIVIGNVKNDLNAIRERKSKLQQLNAAVHRFIAVFAQHGPMLKEEIIDLYRQWTTSFESVSEQLCELQQVSADWQELDVQLSQLHTALRADHDTLRMLDSALQCGLPGTDLADSVARVLADKDTTAKCSMLLDDPSLLLTEGSLSDSGISDSGSELELSEREKRLATLKKLARDLEKVLEPGSTALRAMAQRIEEAEAELRGLQTTCRQLIARSAASHQAIEPVPVPKARTKGKRKKSICPVVASKHADGSSSPRPSWLWRVIRSALPFQLAMVALLCVACLLEPQCCDAVNNFSSAAHFRYVRGPPPV